MDILQMSRLDRREFKDGYAAFERGDSYPDEETFDEYYIYGWCKARVHAGLDPKALDKLSQQLKALGFTIPNEEN